MILPVGIVELTTVEDVQAAWGDLFTYRDDPDDNESELKVAFANNPRVAIGVDGIYVKLRCQVHAGEPLELTDILKITEPSVGIIRQTDKVKGDVDKAIHLLGAVCHVPNGDIHKMGGGDFKLIGEILDHFF